MIKERSGEVAKEREGVARKKEIEEGERTPDNSRQLRGVEYIIYITKLVP